MRIGIDIDNCISNFDDVLLEEYIKHDKELRNTGIINDKPYHITVGMMTNFTIIIYKELQWV